MNPPTRHRLIRARHYVRRNWPQILLFVVVVSLLWMAAMLAIRSGLFVPSGERPAADQVKIFLVFVGGGLGTAATVFTALITREHDARERDRLRLQTVIESLQSLPADHPGPRVAGVLSTMVLLGHERVGIRVLEPAWDEGLVDDATATWLVGQVMTGHSHSHSHDTGPTGDAAVNQAAVIEATALLRIHADHLASEKKGSYNFPGPCLRDWGVGRTLPYRAKDNLLLAMAQVLLSRPPQWWLAEKDPPKFPTESLLKCLEEDGDQVIRSSAATLLEAIRSRYPDTYDNKFCAGRQRLLRRQEDEAEKGKDLVPGYYHRLARSIREEWESPPATQQGGQNGTPEESGSVARA